MAICTANQNYQVGIKGSAKLLRLYLFRPRESAAHVVLYMPVGGCEARTHFSMEDYVSCIIIISYSYTEQN